MNVSLFRASPLSGRHARTSAGAMIDGVPTNRRTGYKNSWRVPFRPHRRGAKFLTVASTTSSACHGPSPEHSDSPKLALSSQVSSEIIGFADAYTPCMSSGPATSLISFSPPGRTLATSTSTAQSQPPGRATFPSASSTSFPRRRVMRNSIALAKADNRTKVCEL